MLFASQESPPRFQVRHDGVAPFFVAFHGKMAFPVSTQLLFGRDVRTAHGTDAATGIVEQAPRDPTRRDDSNVTETASGTLQHFGARLRLLDFALPFLLFFLQGLDELKAFGGDRHFFATSQKLPERAAKSSSRTEKKPPMQQAIVVLYVSSPAASPQSSVKYVVTHFDPYVGDFVIDSAVHPGSNLQDYISMLDTAGTFLEKIEFTPFGLTTVPLHDAQEYASFTPTTYAPQPDCSGLYVPVSSPDGTEEVATEYETSMSGPSSSLWFAPAVACQDDSSSYAPPPSPNGLEGSSEKSE